MLIDSSGDGLMSNNEQQQVGYEEAKIIRSMLEHENNLRNYRFTWFVTLQGLLFSALGFAWGKVDARWLIAMFCVLGFLAAIFSWIEMQLSSKGINELLSWWKDNKPKDYSGPPVIGYEWALVQWIRYLRPSRSLPWLFVVAWMFIFVYKLVNA
jgi:hypothetical protein